MEYGRYDRDSVLADPMFEDANARNFTVKQDSPALKLGFVNIDQKRIGLKADFHDRHK